MIVVNSYMLDTQMPIAGFTILQTIPATVSPNHIISPTTNTIDNITNSISNSVNISTWGITATGYTHVQVFERL